MDPSTAGRTSRLVLTPELWRRVKRIASEALDRPNSERADCIAAACEGDPVLRAEVESLLRSTQRAETCLELPLRPVSLLAPGTMIGPYRLLRELGSGGMGAVYLAERADQHFQQRLAIKVVRGGFGSTFLLQRFLEERQILASLEHPNIARLLDGGATEQGLPYVAMEYIDGEAIDLFCQKRRLSVPARLAIFRDVCAAVQYAHQRLVIHRDIKSANILVTADGTPKLLDFGVAKLLDPSLSPAQQPATLIRAMTPDSASPEQLKGEPVTIAADVYSLGVLLFRLVTGRSPYGSIPRSETELVRAVCEQVPERPSAVVERERHANEGITGRISSDLDVIVLKALRKEPERRYGSAEQFSEDIRRYLEERPVLAAPDSASYRARKFVRRHAVAVAGALAVITALCAGVGATLWQARIAERERARAEREFNAVRTLANSVLGELYDAVAGLKGSIRAREILLRRATDYLDALTSEAGNNLDLSREVARGYQRLGQIQGLRGMENLGDVDGARRSYRKAEVLWNQINAVSSDSRDRVVLADVLLRLGALEKDSSARTAYFQRAQGLIEGLPADVRVDPFTQSIEVVLWHNIGNLQVAAEDYNAARISYGNEVRSAEATARLKPDHLDSSRNLSLAYKQLGAVLERLNAPGEALSLYQKAVALDRGRVAREPDRGVWRLDLSFGVASIGGLLSSQGDLQGARENYLQAVELRQVVVAAEPEDAFAASSLARGYERIAGVTGRIGRVGEAIGWHRQRADLFGARALAHPERDTLWRDYASALVDAVSFALTLLESPATPYPARKEAIPHVQRMLDSLGAIASRWSHEHRPGQPPVPHNVLETLSHRLRELGSR